MNNLTWLMRAARWARNPPNSKQVKLVFAVVGIAIAIVAIEKLGLWPDWAMMEQGRGRRLP